MRRRSETEGDEGVPGVTEQPRDDGGSGRRENGHAPGALVCDSEVVRELDCTAVALELVMSAKWACKEAGSADERSA